MNKQTTPLAKSITTLEGQIVIVANIILTVGAAIPAHVISPQAAAIVAGVMNVALIVQRTILKLQAGSSSQTPAEPLPAFTEIKADPDASEKIAAGS